MAQQCGNYSQFCVFTGFLLLLHTRNINTMQVMGYTWAKPGQCGSEVILVGKYSQPSGRWASTYQQRGASRPNHFFKRRSLSWNDGFVLPVQSFIFSDSDTWRIGRRWFTLSQTGWKFVAHVSKNPHIVALYFQLVLSHQGNIMDVISWKRENIKIKSLCYFPPVDLLLHSQPAPPPIAPPTPPPPPQLPPECDPSLSPSASIFPFVFIYSFVCSCTLHSHSLLRVLWQTCPPLLHSLLLNKVTAKWL